MKKNFAVIQKAVAEGLFFLARLEKEIKGKI
jgi:hypothetical protein